MIAAVQPDPSSVSASVSSSIPSPSGRGGRWRAVLRLTALVLAAWAAVGFGVAWEARTLDAEVFGWPFSFWVAAQGAPIVFVVLIALYARGMTRLEARAQSSGDDGTPAEVQRGPAAGVRDVKRDERGSAVFARDPGGKPASAAGPP